MYLKYYFRDGSLIEFKKYTIDKSGIVRNKKTEKLVRYSKDKSGYNTCNVVDNVGKRRNIRVARAIASTFIGKPPTTEHTADHIDRKRNNDTHDNIRWATEIEQKNNQIRPETRKSAFIIVKDGLEKTTKEWVGDLKSDKNHLGRNYTKSMIESYAQKKQHGFSYKEYPDLTGEVWKVVIDSKIIRGHLEISNMNRVKYVTEHAENVLEGDRIGMTTGGYPTIKFNGKNWLCHILSFMTFFPDDWASKKHDEKILHKEDNKLDFRPDNLRIGTQSQNGIDAHDNGCHDGKQKERQKCASYVDGVFEKEYESQTDAMRYLKSIGFDKASFKNISRALCGKLKNGNPKNAYGRTWCSA